MNYFDVLPDNFFNIFSGSYKHQAAECLAMLFQKTNHGMSFSLDKERAVFLLEDYFDTSQETIEDTELMLKGAREQALYMLRRFKECGWIEEELGENYQYFLHFQDYAIEILKVLSNLNKDESVEYSGYIHTIYQLLKNFTIKNGDVTLEQVFINTEDLFRRLTTLNTNIKKYIQRLLDKKNRNDLTSLLHMLLDEYQSKIVDRAYYNLTTKDHPEKYRQQILEYVNTIEDDEDGIESMLQQMMERKDMTYQDARERLFHQLRVVGDCFENIGELMDEIDHKNSRYVNSALSRITFLLDVHEDMEGKMNRIIKALTKDQLQADDVFHLYQINFIDKDSLYSQKKAKQKMKVNVTEIRELDEQAIKQAKEKYMRDQRFSKTAIKKYVYHHLQGRMMMKANELPIQQDDDFTYLVLVYMYGYSDATDYEIETLEAFIQHGKYQFKNFIIRRTNHG